MQLTFNSEHLKPILAKHASERLKMSITAADIFKLTYEEDEEETITGVVIEFEAPEDEPA